MSSEAMDAIPAILDTVERCLQGLDNDMDKAIPSNGIRSVIFAALMATLLALAILYLFGASRLWQLSINGIALILEVIFFSSFIKALIKNWRNPTSEVISDLKLISSHYKQLYEELKNYPIEALNEYLYFVDCQIESRRRMQSLICGWVGKLGGIPTLVTALAATIGFPHTEGFTSVAAIAVGIIAVLISWIDGQASYANNRLLTRQYWVKRYVELRTE